MASDRKVPRHILLGARVAVVVVVLMLVLCISLLVCFPYGAGAPLHKMLLGLLTVCVVYLFVAMLIALQDSDNTMRLMNFGSVVSDEEPTPQDSQRITLFGEDGLLKLSVSLKNIFFIESDDNYIKVWYSDSSGDVKQYMLRCRLKTVEDSFAGSPLVRCHRKYIVNLMQVVELSRQKEGYVIRLDLHGASPIPVSKTYEKAVLDRFNSR